MNPPNKSEPKPCRNENENEHENSTKMTPKIITGTTTPNLLYKPGKIHKVSMSP
jgi:hypothetical protein